MSDNSKDSLGPVEAYKPDPIPERKLRKALRIFGVAFSVGMLLFAVVVVIVLLALPSTSELRKSYFAARLQKPVNTVEPITMQVRSGDLRQVTSGSTRSVRDVSVAPAAQEPASNDGRVSLADYAVERFVERGDRSLRVCENLMAAPQVAMPVDTSSFGRAVQSQIATDQPNAYTEAALAPLGALLQIPSVGNIALELRNAQESGDQSFLQQAGFYSDVAFAAADVYQNKAALDLVSQHAYHLSIMAKLAQLAPGVANQSDFINLCSQIESGALSPLTTTLESLDEEKAALLYLMGSLGFSPMQVGYDPTLDTRLSIDITPRAVTVLSPWMNSLYRSGLQLSGEN